MKPNTFSRPRLSAISFLAALTWLISSCALAPTPTPRAELIPTSVPATPTPGVTETPAVTAAPAFDIQDLVGIWKAGDVYVRYTADGKYGVRGGLAQFIEGRLEATWVVEGDLIKFYNERGCDQTDVGVYHVKFLSDGLRHSLTLVEDPCEWRKEGPVPAASTYKKFEARVLPGVYQTEVTQAEAEKAGGGDLLKYVGPWEMQLNADDTFELFLGGQSVAKGKYLSADIEFTLDHHDVCPGVDFSVYKAVVDEAGVTFYQSSSLSRNYDCKDMLLILTRHPWVKK